MKTSTVWSWRNFLNLVSYVAIVFIGLSLLIGKIGAGSLAGAFEKIAQILAYLVTAISAFAFAHNRRKWFYYLIWVVCIVLIVVLMVL